MFEQNTAFTNKYEIIDQKIFGDGQFGTIFKCQLKDKNQPKTIFAVKIIITPIKSDYDGAEKEAQLYVLLNHPSIIRTYEYFTLPPYMINNKKYYELAMVMEYAKMDLKTYLQEKIKTKQLDNPRLDKQEFQQFVKSLLTGIYHAHLRNIIIYDVKIQHILVVEEKVANKSLIQFKLSGFSGAIQYEDDQTMNVSEEIVSQIQFTESYSAPELKIMIKQKLEEMKTVHQIEKFKIYPKSDEFSAGLTILQSAGCSDLLFQQINNSLKVAIFYHNDPNNYQQKIYEYEIDLKEKIKKINIENYYGKEYADILEGLLKYNQQKRSSAQEILIDHYDLFMNKQEKNDQQSKNFDFSQGSSQDAAIYKKVEFNQVYDLGIRFCNGNYFYGDNQEFNTELLNLKNNNQFKPNKINGSGKEIFLNSENQQVIVLYAGEFQNGKKEGQEGYQYNMDQELIYKGAFLDDLRDGYGIEFNSTFQNISKAIYEGIFEKNQRNGMGQQFFNSGAKYIGFFENGNPNGEGMYIPGKLEGDYKEPQIYYRGNFKNGYLDGRGKLLNKFTKQIIYEGQFKMDLRHGKGTEYDNNGEPLYGGEIEWLFDKPQFQFFRFLSKEIENQGKEESKQEIQQKKTNQKIS